MVPSAQRTETLRTPQLLRNTMRDPRATQGLPKGNPPETHRIGARAAGYHHARYRLVPPEKPACRRTALIAMRRCAVSMSTTSRLRRLAAEAILYADMNYKISKRAASLSPSLTLAIDSKAKQMKTDGHEVVIVG